MGGNAHRLFGGPPAAVLLRLVFLSVLVGALLALFGVTPGELLRRAAEMARSVFDLGFDTLGEVGRWLLAGAVIVVPLWLVARLLGAAR
jgi:hypothetical protein